MIRPALLAVAASAVVLLGCAGSRPGPAPRSGIDASDPASLTAIADSALVRGDADTARRALEKALRAAPESASVHVGLARYYTAIRRYKDAKESIDRAAEISPLSPVPPYTLGLAYLSAGEPARALASFARAVGLDPSYAPARAAMRPLLMERYRSAGVPAEYSLLPERGVVTRGELAVILAVEFGLDPDHIGWRSDGNPLADGGAIEGAWGARWIKATVARGWLMPFPDGRLHLNDPVTRGALAVLLGALEITLSNGRRTDEPDTLRTHGSDSEQANPFHDLDGGHYMTRAAARATTLGLPARDGGRFEPFTNATGSETLAAVRGLARRLGATPVVSTEPDAPIPVK